MPQPKIHPSQIEIIDFQYPLPDNRIARFPLPERDASKLLIYEQGKIGEGKYRDLAIFLPSGTLLLFNEAKVIYSRLYFQKPTGGKIEVFCLEPEERYPDITSAMMTEKEVFWKCLVKGASKWKEGQILYSETLYPRRDNNTFIKITAEQVRREGKIFIVHFRWQTQNGLPISFSEVLHLAGEIPIPPYLKRKAENSDEIRYQTIFAEKEGSVAAPTAALHFTSSLFEAIKKKSIKIEKLTLHVGAGTFMPVKSERMEGHEMHSEWIEVNSSLVEKLIKQIKSGMKIVAVGTTTVRTIESLYWIGVRILRKEWDGEEELAVSQWYPYRREDEFSTLEALQALQNDFKTSQKKSLITKTQLIIAPGYEWKIINGLVTNFHQPASTLLLMISAMVGNDWRKIYKYALENDFRFLSYGDGSLLWGA